MLRLYKMLSLVHLVIYFLSNLKEGKISSLAQEVMFSQ